MVWGCFVDDKLDPLICIDEHITQDVCIEVLQQNLIPFVNVLANNDITNMTFQQDNTLPHTAC